MKIISALAFLYMAYVITHFRAEAETLAARFYFRVSEAALVGIALYLGVVWFRDGGV